MAGYLVRHRTNLGRLASATVLAAILAAACWPAAAYAPVTIDRQPGFPIRAAFYYPWFPETWHKDDNFHPSLGQYSSSSSAVIKRHIEAMRYGRIDAGIVSWWGRGHRSDRRLGRILAVTKSAGSPFRWAIYYEPEGYGDPAGSTIASDLSYIARRYGGKRTYLRVRGRPVVFVWASGGDGCDMATRWHRATQGLRLYLVLKLFPGYRGCQDQPDSWHEYAPAHASDERGRDSFSISPGFWHSGEARPTLPRNLGRFRNDVRRMAASRARWQLVTTFNEWGEGTAVESAREWASPSGYGDYLDALHAE
jgi:hypothetical protein